MILSNRFLMEEEEDHNEEKKEDNAPSFLKKDPSIYGALLTISLQEIL